MIHLLENTPNQPPKFNSKNWFEKNYNTRGKYSTNIQIKFKTTMLKVILWDYGGAYILVKGIIKITGREADAAARLAGKRNKGVIFKNCASFTDCISEISNTQVDNAKDLGVVMPVYNFIENDDNYSKTSGSLWQYYRDEPNNYNVMIDGRKCFSLLKKQKKLF